MKTSTTTEKSPATQKSEDKVRCVIYTRKSTLKGLEQQYNSLEAQEDRCKSYIELHETQGWEFVKTYSDAGISGGTTDRPGLQAMLKDAKAKKFDMIIVFKLDRMARNQLDFLNMLDTLGKHGVEVASVTEQFDSSSYLGRAMRNLLGVFAEMEREMIAERTREKMEASKRKGLFVAGVPPMGYVRGEDKLLKIDPDAAAIVKGIFQEYALGGSTFSIAVRLNEDGHKRTKRKGEGTRPWNASDVQRILRNPLYAGYIASGEDLYEGQHKAVINRTLWKEVQDRLDASYAELKRRISCKRPRMVYPLAKTLVCAHCGRQMVGTYCIKDEKIYRYYTCPTRKKNGGTECNCPNINAEQIEDFVRGQIIHLREDEEFIAAVIARLPGVPGGRISDSLFHMDKLLEYGTPDELKQIFQLVFTKILFDWENEKIDFKYKRTR